MELDYDIVIIGAGPIGLACAIEAQKAGLKYVIIEKGCLVNSLYYYPQNMTFFSTSEKLEIGNIPFVSTNLKPTRAESLEYYRRVTENYQLHVRLFEEVIQVHKTTDKFEIITSKTSYLSNNVIVASGFYDVANRMNIPGEDLKKVAHYYKDPHYYAMQNILVVGASNSSVDAALETYRKGANVTMVIRGSEISKRVKYWVKPDIENRIEEGSIKAYFNSSLKQITQKEVEISTPTGLVTLTNDFVLALTGYQPNFDFLKKIGIDLSDEQKPKHNTTTMETNIKNLYLAGVVCGGRDTHLWFIENSRIHAQQIIKHIISKN